MEKGSRVKIPANCKRVVVGLGWTPQPQTVVDLDLTGLALKQASDGSIVPYDLVDGEEGGNRDVRPGLQHMGDNVTGEGDGDDENIVVDFNSLEGAVTAVAVAVNARGSQGASFVDVKEAFIRIVNFESGQEFARIDFGSGHTKPGAVFCTLERGKDNGTWDIVVTSEDYTGKSARFARCGLWTGFYASQSLQVSTAEATPLLTQEEWFQLQAVWKKSPQGSAPAALPLPPANVPMAGAALPAVTERADTAQTPPPAAPEATTAPGPAADRAIPRSGPVENCLTEAVLLPNQTGKVQVDLSWPMELGVGAADLDISAVCFTSLGVLVDAAYFNQASAVDGAVVHSGDSKCGEQVSVSLADVRGVRVIVFVVTGHSGADTRVCDNVVCTVKVGKDTLATIPLHDTDAARHPSIVLCMLFAHPETRQWHFAEIRRPARGKTFNLCRREIQAAVDQVIDPGLIQERSVLTAERTFDMKKCDFATVPRAFHRLMVGLGWHPKPGLKVDLDLSCLMLTHNEDGELTPMDMANTKHGLSVRPGVQHLGDNDSGHGDDGDKERILVDLAQVEDSVQALAFVVTIQHSKQSFGDVRDSYVRIMSEDSQHVYATFALCGTLTKPAVVFCTLTRGRSLNAPWTLLSFGEEALGRAPRTLLSRHWVGHLGDKRSLTVAHPMVDAPSSEPGTPHAPPSTPADASSQPPSPVPVTPAPTPAFVTAPTTPAAPVVPATPDKLEPEPAEEGTEGPIPVATASAPHTDAAATTEVAEPAQTSPAKNEDTESAAAAAAPADNVVPKKAAEPTPPGTPQSPDLVTAKVAEVKAAGAAAGATTAIENPTAACCVIS